MTYPHEQMLKAEDGIPLFVSDWMINPPAVARGGIVLMHGLGEHSGRYAHVVRFFNERGLAVRTYDHRGHGRSGGTPGDVPHDMAMLQDAKLVIDDFASQLGRAGSTRLILLGHSMGGLIAARFATARMVSLDGLILSSPALAINMSAGQKMLAKMLGKIASGLAISNGLKTQYLSHDPQVEQNYLKDPLVHPKISPRLLQSMFGAIEFAHSHASELTVPTLLVVSGDDKLVDASGSETFFKRLRPGIGTMHRYDDLYHEVFNELDARRVFNDVDAWLERIL